VSGDVITAEAQQRANSAGGAKVRVRGRALRFIDATDSSTRQEKRSMGSNAKKKTTMAKLNREQNVRERRARKQAKKDARKQAALRVETVPSDTVPPDVA